MYRPDRTLHPRHMDGNYRIRGVGPAQHDLLAGMYDQFDPLGAALGLPPYKVETRRAWIGSALRQVVNLAAFSEPGQVVGHCFLVRDHTCSAELAIFVHQEYRQRGIGKALLKTALEWAGAADFRRVWSITAADNRAALQLQQSCGFHLAKSEFDEIELEYPLRVESFRRRDAMLNRLQERLG